MPCNAPGYRQQVTRALPRHSFLNVPLRGTRYEIMQCHAIQNIHEGIEGPGQYATQPTGIRQQAWLSIGRFAGNKFLHVRFRKPDDIPKTDPVCRIPKFQSTRTAPTAAHHATTRQVTDYLA